MHRIMRWALMGSLLALVAAAAVQQAQTPRSRMAEAAKAFLDSLSEELRAEAAIAFDDANRLDWHYVPRRGRGVRLEQMSDAQRHAAHELLRAALSEQGYQKTTDVIALEDVLRELESRPGRVASHRNTGHYRFSIFGDPGSDAPWGWRVEGHHLSLNFSSIAERKNAATPMFMGANPAEVREGPKKGLRILGTEEDLARELITSMSQEQRAGAVISQRAPRDIIFSPGNDDFPDEPAGINVRSLDAAQVVIAMRLLETITRDNLRWSGDDDAPETEQAMERVFGDQENPRPLHFAWAGGLEPGQPHYWRLTGERFMIEYDNTQNDANHVHLVWRDLTNDFGRDWLREHYAEHHHDE